MKRTIVWVRKVGILIVGSLVVVVGVILIPLPGPGLLVVLLGFMLLALEFEWAERQTDRLKAQLKKTAEAAKRMRK